MIVSRHWESWRGYFINQNLLMCELLLSHIRCWESDFVHSLYFHHLNFIKLLVILTAIFRQSFMNILSLNRPVLYHYFQLKLPLWFDLVILNCVGTSLFAVAWLIPITVACQSIDIKTNLYSGKLYRYTHSYQWLRCRPNLKFITFPDSIRPANILLKAIIPSFTGPITAHLPLPCNGLI